MREATCHPRIRLAAALLCLAGLLSANSPAAAGGLFDDEPKFGSALTSTYEQRVAASAVNQPVKTKTLVVPHVHVAGLQPFLLPRPGRVRIAGLAPVADMNLYVWRVLPGHPKHAEYLTRRRQFGARDWGKLVPWCESSGLGDLAEHELRTQLRRIGDFRAAGYKPVLALWLKYADRRQAPWSLALPVQGEWYVQPDATGHHRLKAGAAYAWDLVVRRDGRQAKGAGQRLQDHYAWSQPVLAQADGRVREVIDKHPDAPIGRSGGFDYSNNVVVDYGGGVVALYGHLKQGSARVKTGQRVRLGQVLGLVGNSGASGAPHLHFTMMDAAYFSVKGRFRYQARRGAAWANVDGKDLQGNTDVRNVPAPQGAPAGGKDPPGLFD